MISGAVPQRVAVVIPAKDEGDRIAATVASARTIAGVDLVVVVDDASTDDTGQQAMEAGAVVERHEVNRGKGAAMTTGAAVVAARDTAQSLSRALLFIDADLTHTAAACAPLAAPVLAGSADMAIAVLPPQGPAGGRGRVVRTARRGVLAATGFAPQQPLSGMRCLTRQAFEAALPLAHGWGVETGLTIDVLRRGFRVTEVPCAIQHRVSPATVAGAMHRGEQFIDVLRALWARGVLVDVVKNELKSRRES